MPLQHKKSELNFKTLMELSKETIKSLIMTKESDLIDLFKEIKIKEIYQLIHSEQYKDDPERLTMVLTSYFDINGFDLNLFKFIAMQEKHILSKNFGKERMLKINNTEFTKDSFKELLDVSENIAKERVSHRKNGYSKEDIFIDQYLILKKIFCKDMMLKDIKNDSDSLKTNTIINLLTCDKDVLDVIIEHLNTTNIKKNAKGSKTIVKLIGGNDYFDMIIEKIKEIIKTNKSSLNEISLLATSFIELDRHAALTKHQKEIIDGLDQEVLMFVEKICSSVIDGDYNAFIQQQNMLAMYDHHKESVLYRIHKTIKGKELFNTFEQIVHLLKESDTQDTIENTVQ